MVIGRGSILAAAAAIALAGSASAGVPLVRVEEPEDNDMPPAKPGRPKVKTPKVDADFKKLNKQDKVTMKAADEKRARRAAKRLQEHARGGIAKV